MGTPAPCKPLGSSEKAPGPVASMRLKPSPGLWIQGYRPRQPSRQVEADAISVLRSLWDRQHNKPPHKSGLVIEVSFVQGPIGMDMTVSLHLYHVCFSLAKHNCTSPFPIFYTSRSLLIAKIVRFIGVFIEPIWELTIFKEILSKSLLNTVSSFPCPHRVKLWK